MARKHTNFRMKIREVSAAQLRQAADIKAKMEAAQAELVAILGGGMVGNGLRAPAAIVVPGKKLHWTQTPKGRARIARIARASWRKRRS